MCHVPWSARQLFSGQASKGMVSAQADRISNGMRISTILFEDESW
jgi:hypothetical protein